MVRVISAHHFVSQEVNTIPEAAACAVASPSKLLVATNDHEVEVRNVEEAGRMIHSFSTVDHVGEIRFSPIGRYVLTLESKRGGGGGGGGRRLSSPEFRSVRVYTNWETRHPAELPVRARIAGRVTPSCGRDGKVGLEMIELPLRDSASCVAVCPGTGNVLVGCQSILVVYKYCLKNFDDRSKARYVDFDECLHVFIGSIPTEISICEDVIGWLSNTEVHVFKVKIVDRTDEKNLKSLSMYSFSSESDSSLDPLGNHSRRNSDPDASQKFKKPIKNITVKKYEDSDDPVNAGGAKSDHAFAVINLDRIDEELELRRQARPECFPETLKFACVEKANKEYGSIGTPRIIEEVLGPKTPPAFALTEIKLVRGWLHSSLADREFEAEAVTLVHARLVAEEWQHDRFHCLNLQPVYWREYHVKRKPASPGGGRTTCQHPLQSSVHLHLMSVTTCFSSVHEAYLYHLPGHVRKKGRGVGVRRIMIYPFTSPVKKIVLESSLLHALTETGLETYTLRSGYFTVREAENVNGRTNACPGTEVPICLIGLRPFLGTRDLFVCTTHLVILASADDAISKLNGGGSQQQQQPPADDEKSWTLYSLRLPSSMALFDDMLKVGQVNRSNSPSGYFQLLSEAHVVLRTSYHRLTWLLALKAATVEEEFSKVADRYQESCALLGDYYVLLEDEAEFRMCVPYYRISKLPIQTVVDRVLALWRDTSVETKKLPCGFVYYLTQLVLNPTEDEKKMEASMVDRIFELFGKYCIGKLSVFILQSNIQLAFKTQKVYEYFESYFEDVDDPDAKDVLAFAAICIEMDIPSKVSRTLKSLASVGLSEVLLEYHHLLFDKSTGNHNSFSGLALLIKNCNSEVFVEVFVSLIKSDVLSLGAIMQMFLASFVSVAGSPRESVSSAEILQMFLETYFVESISELTPDDFAASAELCQALNALVRSYLTGLSTPISYGDETIDSDLYGLRHAYLDKLPPFNRQTSNLDANLIWMENNLFKLQSFLCSDICLAESRRIVADYLAANPRTLGRLSLKTLCSNNRESISLILEEEPGVIFLFATEILIDDADWKLVTDGLVEKLGDTDDEEQKALLTKTLWDVLDHMAQTVPPERFLRLLPSDEISKDSQFYEHIQRCQNIQQANHIQSLIVSTGNQLLSTLTL